MNIIENKNRIISAFDSIRQSILSKGVVVPYNNVSTYPNAIRTIGDSSNICSKVITSASTARSIGGALPVSCILPAYTFDKSMNCIIYYGAYGEGCFNSSTPNEFHLYLNGTEIPSVQPTGYTTKSMDYNAVSNSGFVSTLMSSVGFTPLKVNRGDVINAEFILNYVMSPNSYPTMLEIVVFSDEEIYIIKWNSPLASYGSYLNTLDPASTTTSQYGYKQLYYYNVDTNQWAIKTPYSSGSILAYSKYANLYLRTYAGNSTSMNSVVQWVVNGVGYTESGNVNSGKAGSFIYTGLSITSFENLAALHNKVLDFQDFGNMHVLTLTRRNDASPSTGSFNWSVDVPVRDP